jgi:two-component system phosphate regulon sensor histidine kinase PhoR
MALLVLLTAASFLLLLFTFSGNLGAEIKGSLRTLRVTLIASDGAVLFDNRASAEGMENHLGRPEVQEALQKGYGESERLSGTLGETTRYYAMRLNDGNILRLALTASGAQSLAARLLPLLLFCLLAAALAAFLMARVLTRRLVGPINAIDLDDPDIGPYEELLPFIQRMERQKRELAGRRSDLEEREETLRMIMQSVHEGLILIDGHGKVRMANLSALEILGAKEAAGRNIVELCRDADFLEKLRMCREGARTEMVFRKEDRIYSVFFNPARGEESASGTMILFVDTTERYTAEAQRKEFSANVSHELKTPLTTISALSEMIAGGQVKPEDLSRFGEKIHAQSRRLISTIEDIIRLSEFDEGNAAREFCRFDLKELAASVAEALQDKAAKQGISVEVERGEPLMVTANRRMIDELLYNLIDNAITYNRAGGSVSVSLKEEEGFRVIAVRDTGIGIAKTHLGRIFERFYRVDKSRSKRTGGTGLGLSIVKHIAEFHGGRVELTSEEGKGSCVRCFIRGKEA